MSTITVSNTNALLSALKVVQSGDTILLASGTYSSVTIRDFKLDGVTIASQDESKPAVLSDLMVRGSTGITFKDLEFVTDPANGSDRFQVIGSRDIHFDGLNVHGSLDGNPQNDTSAMIIRTSDNVTVKNSEFHELANAVTHLDSTNVTFDGNYFHDIRMDGIRGGGTSQLTITNNYFTNFRPVIGDHPDAIQVWNANTTTSARDILISGNIITRGDGEPVQGIFVTAQQTPLPYYNVQIVDNVVLGGLYNGIMVRGAVGVVLEDNTVAGYDGMRSWIRLENINGIELSDNASTDYQKDVNVIGKVDTNNVKLATPIDFGEALVRNWLAEHSVTSEKLLDFLGFDGSIDGAASIQPPKELPQVVTPPTQVEVPAPQPPVEQPPVTAIKSAASVVMNEVVRDVQLTGNQAADVVGNQHDNHIVGNKGDNVLIAGAGDDTLDWGAGGADRLIGGVGDDVYIVGPSTVVVEQAGEGVDTIMSMYAVKLQANVENLILLNSGGQSGTGNELDNLIIGNAGNNVLDGGAGNDTIRGGAGKDVIIGGPGNDILYGEAGADYFRFGVGSGHDVIMDFGGGGDREGIDFMSWVKAGAKVTFADVDGGTLITFDADNTVFLMGVDSGSLQIAKTGAFIN